MVWKLREARLRCSPGHIPRHKGKLPAEKAASGFASENVSACAFQLSSACFSEVRGWIIFCLRLCPQKDGSPPDPVPGGEHPSTAPRLPERWSSLGAVPASSSAPA